MSVLAVSLSSFVTMAHAGSKLDKKLPEYKKASGVTGNLSSVGSDTLANLMALWTEEFTHLYPNVNVQVQAAGSSTAPPALTEGTSNFGPMSRKMKDKELKASKKRGFKLIWETIQDNIQEDQRTIPGFALMLSSSSRFQGHFTRTGAVIDFINTLTGKNREEHTRCASI